MADAEPRIDIDAVENERYWRCVIEYGDAKIILVSKSETGGGQLETLVRGLPQIMHQLQIAQRERGQV